MTDSILDSTKKVVNLDPSYTAFDQDIISFINSAFVTLHQLGLGPDDGFWIESSAETWDEFITSPPNYVNMVKTYVFLRVRMLFDPPTTSFLISAMNEQIREYEWRLNVARENELSFPLVVVD